jgi:hypothetical protein
VIAERHQPALAAKFDPARWHLNRLDLRWLRLAKCQQRFGIELQQLGVITQKAAQKCLARQIASSAAIWRVESLS